MRCLLVEDHASTRELIHHMLKCRGHEVTEFEEAESAWDAYQANPFEFALIDWMLPVKDGLSLCRDIRKHPDGARSVVLMCTARRSPEELNAVLEAGADDYLAKPFEPDLFEIRMQIAEHLAVLKVAEHNRRKLETQIQHAQRLESLGVLAGGIAHDFNNLLVSVIGNADLALMDMTVLSSARSRILAIKTAGQRAAELTTQMLAYSGKGRFVVEPVNLNELIEEMGQLLQVSIPKSVVLKPNFSPNLPAIEADSSQMRQVVMNLITNAAEAIGEQNGVIHVSTGIVEADRQYLTDAYLNENLPEGDYVFLEVSDTGCGMDEATRQKIFDPFFSTKFTGRGLGLAAVLGIIRGHHGAINVYSEVNRGTTFKILLPATKQQARKQGDQEDSDMREWRSDGTLLVVDDEEGILSVMKMTLERCGFEVLTAKNGRDGIDIFRKQAPRIRAVILDMTMPEMNGEESYRELRRIRSDVPVILSSGHSEQDATSRFSGKGLAGFVKKPFTLKELTSKVREVLEAV